MKPYKKGTILRQSDEGGFGTLSFSKKSLFGAMFKLLSVFLTLFMHKTLEKKKTICVVDKEGNKIEVLS